MSAASLWFMGGTLSFFIVVYCNYSWYSQENHLRNDFSPGVLRWMATIVGYLQLPICHTETLSAMFAITNTKTKDNYKDTDNYKDKDKVY